MKQQIDNFINIRAGGKVERCHTIPREGSYSVASHSWGVAMIMHQIWPEDFQRLCLICLTHDVTERFTGDIPYPLISNSPVIRRELKDISAKISAKLGIPSEASLSDEDYVKLKACDQLELWTWAREQVYRSGNTFAFEIVTALEEHWEKFPLPERAEKFKLAMIEYVSLPRPASKFLEELLK